MSYVRAIVHAVWATKLRRPLLHPDIRKGIFDHLCKHAEEKSIKIICINGDADHVHVLFSLRPTQTIAKCVQFFKGESSRWINAANLVRGGFHWQRDYYAATINPDEQGVVIRYIQEHDNRTRTLNLDQELIRITSGT